MNFKTFYTESIEKKISNKGDFQVKGNRMLFQRVGPVSSQYQSNTKAPERRGIWAFPWPVFDYFFVSGSFSDPSRRMPKNTWNVRISSEMVEKLKAILFEKEKQLGIIRGKFINFKDRYKDSRDKELSKEYDNIEYVIETLKDIIKERHSNAYDLESFGIEVEEKEAPTIKLSKEQIRELEQTKKKLDRNLKSLKDKMVDTDRIRVELFNKMNMSKNTDNEEKDKNTYHNFLRSSGYHKISTDIQNLGDKISDIEDLLSDKESANKRNVHTFFHGEKFNKTSQFWYSGVIYAHFAPKGRENEMINSWFKYDTVSEYLEQLKKNLFVHEKLDGKFYKYAVKNIGHGDYGLASDHLEVFLPNIK